MLTQLPDCLTVVLREKDDPIADVPPESEAVLRLMEDVLGSAYNA